MAMKKDVEKMTYSVVNATKNFRMKIWRDDQDVQRMTQQWTKKMKDEFIYTAIKQNYIPPIILAYEIPDEKGMCEAWLVDGLQRLSTLTEFKNNEYKLSRTFNVELGYDVVETDTNGEAIIENGKIKRSFHTINLKNKYYCDLPEEVQNIFNEANLEIVKHIDCTPEEISHLVYIYNNHVAMNKNQVGFTYIPKFARQIRSIKNESNFFYDVVMPAIKKKNADIKGDIEKLIIEAINLVYHPDNWMNDFANMCKYINDNATIEELNGIADIFDELNDLCERFEIGHLFVSKQFACLIDLYSYCKEIGYSVENYGNFLTKFNFEQVEEMLVQTNKNENKTKNKILKRKEMYREAFNKYMGYTPVVNIEEVIDEAEVEISTETIAIPTDNVVDLTETELDFVKRNVTNKVIDEDIELYKEDLEALTLDVIDDRLNNNAYYLALIGIVAYGYKKDIIIDSWFKEFIGREIEVQDNADDNYVAMLEDLNRYLKGVA